MDDLKRLITGLTINIEKKGVDVQAITNYANYVFITNDEKPFEKVDGGSQRRFAIFRMSDKYAYVSGDDKFWVDFYKRNINQEMADKFAMFLKDRQTRENIRKWPVTEYYKEMVDEEEQDHVIVEYLTNDDIFLRDFPDGIAQSSKLLTKCNEYIYNNFRNDVKKLDSKELKTICVTRLKWKHEKYGKARCMHYLRPKEIPKEQ